MSPWRFYKCGSYWESCVFFKQIEDSESQTCHSLMVLTPLYLVTSLTGLTLKRFCFGCWFLLCWSQVLRWNAEALYTLNCVCVTEEFSLKNIRRGNNAEWFWEIRALTSACHVSAAAAGLLAWDDETNAHTFPQKRVNAMTCFDKPFIFILLTYAAFYWRYLF